MKGLLRLQNLPPLPFQISKHFIFCASWYILHRIADYTNFKADSAQQYLAKDAENIHLGEYHHTISST